MKTLHKIIIILLFLVSYTGFSQTAEQLKMIEKGKKMQDSIMNTAMYKELMQINDQTEAHKKEKKQNEIITVKQKDNNTNSKPKIMDYPFGSLDVNVMVLPLGMKNPIKIGSMSKSGDIVLDFPKELPEISKKVKESESSKLGYTLFSICDVSSKMVAEKDAIFSFDTGALSLWTNDDRFVGVIFTVSDENLMPWVEDSDNSEPILGSYFELIYVASNYKYQSECSASMELDGGTKEVLYQYDLNLKAGFNFIEYRIESIYKTDPKVMASVPDKVSVTSVEGIPNCKWIGRYF